MVELIMVELIIPIIKGLENGRVGLPFSRYYILDLEDGRVV